MSDVLIEQGSTSNTPSRVKVELAGTYLLLEGAVKVYAEGIRRINGHFWVERNDGLFDIYEGRYCNIVISKVSNFKRLSKSTFLTQDAQKIVRIYSIIENSSDTLTTSCLMRSFRDEDYIFGANIIVTDGDNKSSIINRQGKLIKELIGEIVGYDKDSQVLFTRSRKEKSVTYAYNVNGNFCEINADDAPVASIKGFKNVFCIGNNLYYFMFC